MIVVIKKGIFMKLKWNLVFLLSLSMLANCGQKAKEEDEEVQDVRNVNAYDWDTQMRDAAPLTEEEYGVAKNICTSFQNMRAFMATQASGLSLDFRVEIKNCGANLTEHSESANLNYSRSSGVTMTPSSRNTSLATDILSDRHERLNSICTEVLADNRPSNMITDGVLRYQVNFFTGAGYEWVQIAEFKQNAKGVYFPYLIEKAGIVTPMSSSRIETHGFTKYRGIHHPCSNNTNSYTLQEWL